MTLTKQVSYHDEGMSFTFCPKTNHLEHSYEKELRVKTMHEVVELKCSYYNDKVTIKLISIMEEEVFYYRGIVTKENYDKLCCFFKSVLLHILSTKQPQVLPL